MKTKTLIMSASLAVVSSLLPSASQGQAPANPESAIAIVLTRATNQLIEAKDTVRTITVWTDYTLQPGEGFSVCVQRGTEPLHSAPAFLSVHWSPEQTNTASGFNWFFGGPLGQGFEESDAEAALAQIQERFADRTLTLKPGEPQQLFSVRNQEGAVMNGLIEFTRTTPSADKTAEAIVHLRNIQVINPTAPGVGYAATVPPGYALRATANTGFATTISPAGPDQYHSSWMNLPTPRPIIVTPGQRPALLSPRKPLSFAEMETQRNVLQSQLQELQDQGPIQVTLGAPKQIFSVTNASGEVFQGFLELVGPGTLTSSTTQAAPATEAPSEPPIPLAEPPRRQLPPISPATGTATGQPSTTIDPSTGLPRAN